MTTLRGAALVVDHHELFGVALSSLPTTQLGFACIPKALSAEEIAEALVRVVAGEVFVSTPDPARGALHLAAGPRPTVPPGTGAGRLRHLTPRQGEVHAFAIRWRLDAAPTIASAAFTGGSPAGFSPANMKDNLMKLYS